MAEWTTQRGVNMPAKGQRGAMECWITCYEMMLNANGINWTKEQIVKRMANRGFGDAALCVNAGLSDPELAQCATALGVGQSSTSAVNTFEGLRNMLLMCGPRKRIIKRHGRDANHVRLAPIGNDAFVGNGFEKIFVGIFNANRKLAAALVFIGGVMTEILSSLISPSRNSK
jgi:hypothetical protein